ncbi:hypothetical protein ABTY20_31915 [Streptomyces sp. NPDC126497]
MRILGGDTLSHDPVAPAAHGRTGAAAEGDPHAARPHAVGGGRPPG